MSRTNRHPNEGKIRVDLLIEGDELSGLAGEEKGLCGCVAV